MSVATTQKTCGYHYTSAGYWDSIKQLGLLPATTPELTVDLKVAASDTAVTWVFDQPREGVELIGVLIDIAKRHETQVVLGLKVEYDYSDSVEAKLQETQDQVDPEDRINLTHKIDFGRFGHADAGINLLTSCVPPDDISFIGLWDFDNLLLNILEPES